MMMDRREYASKYRGKNKRQRKFTPQNARELKETPNILHATNVAIAEVIISASYITNTMSVVQTGVLLSMFAT